MNQVYAQNNIIDVPIGLQNAKPQHRLQPDMFKLPQKHSEASPYYTTRRTDLANTELTNFQKPGKLKKK